MQKYEFVSRKMLKRWLKKHELKDNEVLAVFGMIFTHENRLWRVEIDALPFWTLFALFHTFPRLPQFVMRWYFVDKNGFAYIPEADEELVELDRRTVAKVEG